MIGVLAFLLQLPLVVVPVLILLGVLVLVLRSKKTQTSVTNRTKVTTGVVVTILVLLAATGGFRLAQQIQYHSVIRKLSADSVDSIQVGEARLSNAADVRAVVLALHEDQWYEPLAGDGGRAQALELLIHFKSGEELRYPIARHLRYKGAVIDFVNQDTASRVVSHYGYAFAQRLPEVLDRLGAHLPTEKKDSL